MREDSRYTFLTQKERDNETGLDYFGARYYANTHGRFTSIDPMGFTAGLLANPQNMNRYAYTRNNPLTYIDPDGKCSVPAGLKQGSVGICFEAFIAAPRIGPGGIGHGDGRTFDGNNPNLTARVTVWVIVSTDTERVYTSKTEQISQSVVTVGVGVKDRDKSTGDYEAKESTIAMQGTATTDVKLSNINSNVGEKDFGAGVDVTVSIANGTNGGQQLGKNMQTTGVVMGGNAGMVIAGAGKVVEALSPAGTIDGNVTVRITGSGQVTRIGGESRGFPSYAAYFYTVGTDGNIVTQEIVTRRENKIEDLTKPMTPFPR